MDKLFKILILCSLIVVGAAIGGLLAVRQMWDSFWESPKAETSTKVIQSVIGGGEGKESLLDNEAIVDMATQATRLFKEIGQGIEQEMAERRGEKPRNANTNPESIPPTPNKDLEKQKREFSELRNQIEDLE